MPIHSGVRTGPSIFGGHFFFVYGADFIAATSRAPQDDDLERCNCPLAGTPGHWMCGWNHERNRPQYEVGPVFKEPPP